jgi:hypothetical protein
MLTIFRKLLAEAVSLFLLVLGIKGPSSTNSGLLHLIDPASLQPELPPYPWPRIGTEEWAMKDETDAA